MAISEVTVRRQQKHYQDERCIMNYSALPGRPILFPPTARLA
jgi:hypothetical protein